jgi:hypothetical protein
MEEQRLREPVDLDLLAVLDRQQYKLHTQVYFFGI